jgi:hypothetical protein
VRAGVAGKSLRMDSVDGIDVTNVIGCALLGRDLCEGSNGALMGTLDVSPGLCCGGAGDVEDPLLANVSIFS